MIPFEKLFAASDRPYTGENRWVLAMLLLTVSMGMLDAISLLHLGTFTGYFTGALILAGANIGQGHALNTTPFVALVAALCGAVIGGRAVRRRHPRHILVSQVLFAVAAFLVLAACVDAIGGSPYSRVTVAMLGFAMGMQISASRYAAVADMTMPAATMALHGLAHDSRLAGGSGERSFRRFAVLIALFLGAILGAILSTWQPQIGMLLCASIIGSSAMLLFRAPPD